MRYPSLGGLVGQTIKVKEHDDRVCGTIKREEKYTIIAAYPHFVIGERKTEDGVIIRDTFNRGTLVAMGYISGGHTTWTDC